MTFASSCLFENSVTVDNGILQNSSIVMNTHNEFYNLFAQEFDNSNVLIATRWYKVFIMAKS